MKAFSYACSTRIEMGEGQSQHLAQLISEISPGRTLLLVVDPGVLGAGLIDSMVADLKRASFEVHLFSNIVQNPRDIDCMAGADVFRTVKADAVVAIGGGSAMDTGKAIALLGPSGGAPNEFVDGIRPYADVAPIVCVPTTAGTGSEVTRSAVITEEATHRKMTLKHARLRPTLAVLDPVLTYSVPSSVAAATGVDALVHAIEGYSCRVSNPISQALGARAMSIIVNALPKVMHHRENTEARADMLLGSLLAGLCFGSADVAAVHCLAEALGGLYDTPHGVANAVFLSHVIRFNAKEHLKTHAQMARYMGFAGEGTADEQAVENLVHGVDEFTRNLGIPTLNQLGSVQVADFDRLARLAFENNSTPSNIRTITESNYRQILEEAWEWTG